MGMGSVMKLCRQGSNAYILTNAAFRCACGVWITKHEKICAIKTRSILGWRVAIKVSDLLQYAAGDNQLSDLESCLPYLFDVDGF